MTLTSPFNPMDPSRKSTTRFQITDRKLKLFFCALAILLGSAQAWAGRFQLNPDGVSYIEVGEAYPRWDLHAALNGYWSPFYCWLLGAGLKVFHPAPYWEFPFIHLINFFIFLAALGCFNFFIASLIGYHYGQSGQYRESGLAVIPELVWIAFGYTLFILSSVRMISVWIVTPDMCAAAFIYLAAGMILRIHAGVTTWRNYFVLGICLGFGYLAKAAVLPVAVLFILAGFSPGHRVRKWLPQAGMTLAGLTLIAAPYVILLSQRLGHFTFGETPKLAFAYQPNNIPLMHWQGGPPGLGKPVHPTRKIFERPAAFEFATPIPGTYPPGYDPTYWNEGVTPRFDFQQEKARIITSVPRLLDMFLGRFVSGVPATATMPALSAGILLMYVLAPKWRVSLRNLAGQWFLLVPPLGAFLMYALVLMETRYVGAYYAVFCAGLLAGVALPDLPEAKKWATTLTVQVVSVTLLILVIVTGFDVLIGANVGPKQWQVAEYLHQAGVRRGEQVAQVCGNGNLGWARLARVRITAEVPPASMRDYIQADDTLRSQVVSALFATGVKAIVSGIQQKTGCPTEWREVADTGMYVCTAPGLSSDALQGSPSANPHSVNH